MKKLLVVLGLMGLLCASVSPLWAGGILNKSNLSADYFRSLTRHGSTDAADIIAYNPAGLMKMDNGFYTKLDVLYIAKDYSNTIPGSFPVPGATGKLSSDTPTVIPGFFSVYKMEKWAGFFAVTVPGGGGKVEYDSGNARTAIIGGGIINSVNNMGFGPIYTGVNNMSLEADSFDLAFTLGGAYEINDIFSVAGGLRYIDAKYEIKGQVALDKFTLNPASALFPSTYGVDLERTATGWGYFLGLNVAPLEKLNIGALYQSNTELDYKSDVAKDDPGITPGIGWADGTKQREDLPGFLGLGVSYQFTPKIRAEVDYTRYLESNATLEATRFDNAGDSWEVGISVTYTFNPQWRASIGYLDTNIEGMDSQDLLVEAPELDAKSIGLGAVYSPSEKWQFSVGYTNVDYDSVTTDTASQIAQRAPAGTKLEKDVWAISFGAQYRWF